MELKEIQDKIQEEGYKDGYLARENDVLSKYHDIITKEQEFWKNRLRVTWLAFADRNTKFFYLSTMKHRASNRINYILRNDIKFEYEEEIRYEVVQYFNEVLSVNLRLILDVHQCLIDAIPCILNEENNKNFQLFLPAKKLEKVVFSFKGDKAPDLDGFPMFFFQNFWDIVTDDVCNVVKDFFGARRI